ncbi:DUF2637 domain-containing protein [Luedemannella flava]
MRTNRHQVRVAERELAQLRRFQWAVRATLALGVAASVCANVLHAQHNVIAQIIAAWPPLALMLSVELISRIPVHRRALAALRIFATAVIAGIAAYVSYFHMAAVVLRYGEQQPNPYLLPISVDGLILVASVSLVELAGRVRAIREELAGILHNEDPTGEAPPHAHRQAESALAHSHVNGHVTTVPLMEAFAPMPHPASASVDALPPDTPVTAPPRAAVGPVAVDHEESSDDGPDRGVDPEIAALLPAARAARAALQREGRSLTRDSLAAQLRQNGHTIRTSRVSAVLNHLRNDEAAANAGRVPSPSGPRH